MGTLARESMPSIGEGFIWKGSGMPFEAYDAMPVGLSVGDILRMGDRTFVMAKAGGNITSMGLGAKNSLCQGLVNSAAAATTAAGGTSVIITTPASCGAAGTGLVAVDEFKGGYIVIFSAAGDFPQVRGIIANTARTASGSKPVTFTLDSPLLKACTISTSTAEAMHSPWAAVVQDNSTATPVVGMPTVTATTGQYLWLQTAGPCFVSPQAGVGVGIAQACFFRHDGSIDVHANIGAYVTAQYAGYVLSESLTGTQAAPFIMLSLLR